MKNKWLRVMTFVVALVCIVSFGAFNVTVDAAEEKMSEAASTLQENLVTMVKQYNTKAEVDEYVNALIQSYGEEISESIKETYQFLYDWVEVKKEIGDFEKVTDFSCEEDKNTAEISSATMEIKCKKGDAVITYVLVDENAKITMERKATFGELMKNAALNTVLGMGTVFAVLIFICLIISSFGLFKKDESKDSAVSAPAAAPADAADIAADDDVTDDLELVAVVSAAIAAAEGTSADGFQVRSIKRVRKANW